MTKDLAMQIFLIVGEKVGNKTKLTENERKDLVEAIYFASKYKGEAA